MVLSSVESVSYLTELRPRKWKRLEPVLLVHWADFRYASMKPVGAHQ